MKLLKEKAVMKEGIQYFRYTININPKIIRLLEWRKGQNLTAIVNHKDKTLTIKPTRDNE